MSVSGRVSLVCVGWCVVGLAVSFEGVYVVGVCVKYACLVVRCFLWVVV